MFLVAVVLNWNCAQFLKISPSVQSRREQMQPRSCSVFFYAWSFSGQTVCAGRCALTTVTSCMPVWLKIAVKEHTPSAATSPACASTSSSSTSTGASHSIAVGIIQELQEQWQGLAPGHQATHEAFHEPLPRSNGSEVTRSVGGAEEVDARPVREKGRARVE